MENASTISNALIYPFGQEQKNKTQEQLVTSHNLLWELYQEAEKQRKKEKKKNLQIQRELQAQRERLGRDLHDGLGSQLNHIISRLDLLACAIKPDPKQLQRLGDFAREMNQTLRETLWVLDHETITADAFAARLHGLLMRIWDDRELPLLKWHFQNSPDNLILSPLIAMHLVRITQEATSNALKYAGATQVQINFTFYNKELMLCIEDNGIGFNPTMNGNGYGITNMRKRAAEVNGIFTLRTKPTGTQINVKIPLNN